jgi:hypothetical protein
VKKHSPHDLETASDYLEFIIHMAEDDMNSLDGWTEPTWKRNVHIDPILIRLGALIEFLTAKDTAHGTDVVARHYIPGFALHQNEHDRLLAQKRLVDTTLAHLTLVPIPKLISEVKFPYPDMNVKVMERLKLFFDSRPPHVLDQTRSTFGRAYDLIATLA